MDAATARKRDIRVTSLVGVAHGFSHFYQLALPPLFPLMHAAEGLSYLDLFKLITIMYIASAVLQPPAGFLVDRFGARPLWLGGFTLMALGTVLYGIAPSYDVMIVAAVMLGVGNSVFHPCDYSILSATISEKFMGRAFSLHMFGGYIGYALAPVALTAAGELFGWHAAILGAGIAGIVVVVLVALGSGDVSDGREEGARRAAPPVPFSTVAGTLFQAPMMLCWLFFCLGAMGQIGLQTKTSSILSLPETYGLDLKLAGFITTAMLLGVVAGVLTGGFVADRTKRHDFVVGLGYGTSALMMLLMWLVHLPIAAIFAIYLVTGFFYGIVFPSRDMMVRQSTPKGASGKVFGFVYSGMDVGSFITPVLFGWFIDEGIPMTAYLCVAVMWAVAIVVLKMTSISAARRVDAPVAAE